LVGFPPASRATDACPERHMHTTSRPSAAAQLYDPNFEHDACGIALIARLHGEASHDVVARAIGAIEHLFHRGAAGADPDTGDGAGLLLQVPDALLRETVGFELPAPGTYGVAV